MEKPLMFHLEPGKVRQRGPLGKMLSLSIANRLKMVNYAHLVDPFRFRYERDRAWRCEFWGKIVRSAILSWCGLQDAELLSIIKETVNDLLSTHRAKTNRTVGGGESQRKVTVFKSPFLIVHFSASTRKP